jgi:hypothetical protein
MTIVTLSVAVVIVLVASLAIHTLGYDSLSVPSGVGLAVDVAAVGLLAAFGWGGSEMRGRWVAAELRAGRRRCHLGRGGRS